MEVKCFWKLVHFCQYWRRCEALRKSISLHFHFLNAVFVWYLEKNIEYFYEYLILQEANQEN